MGYNHELLLSNQRMHWVLNQMSEVSSKGKFSKSSGVFEVNDIQRQMIQYGNSRSFCCSLSTFHSGGSKWKKLNRFFSDFLDVVFVEFIQTKAQIQCHVSVRCQQIFKLFFQGWAWSISVREEIDEWFLPDDTKAKMNTILVINVRSLRFFFGFQSRLDWIAK